MAEQQENTSKEPITWKTWKPLDDLLAGFGSAVAGLPHQVLSVAELSGIASPDIRKSIDQVVDKYIKQKPGAIGGLEGLSVPPQTLSGKLGGLIGDTAQTVFVPEGKVAQAGGKVAKYVVPAVKEAVAAATQELSKTKDFKRAGIAGATALGIGAAAKGISGHIAKAAEQHPYDAILGSWTNPRYIISEAIKTARAKMARPLGPDDVERMVDTFQEFKQPFTTVGHKALQTSFKAINDSIENAADLSQRYAEKLAQLPGVPPTVKAIANPGRFVNQAISDLKKNNPIDSSAIDNWMKEFSSRYPGITSGNITIPQIEQLTTSLSKFVTPEYRAGKNIVSADPVKDVVGEALYNAAKQAETHAVHALRNIGEKFSPGTPLANEKPWEVVIDIGGQKVPKMYDEAAQKARDLWDLTQIAASAASKQTTGLGKIVSLIGGRLLPTLVPQDPAALAKLGMTVEKYGLGGKPLAESIAKKNFGLKTAAAGASFTRRPPSEAPPVEPDFSKGALTGRYQEPSDDDLTIVKNNNPAGLRPSTGELFNGEQEGGEGGYAKFNTPAEGIRAAALTIQTYQDRYGLNTIREIMNRYAPKEDKNNPDAYAESVAKFAGVDPDEKINTKDPELMKKILSAIVSTEATAKNAPRFSDDINAGIDMAFEKKTERPPAGRKEPDFSIGILR